MHKIFGTFLAGRAAAGLLLVRVVFGIALIQHGWPKIQNPFGWMPPAAGMPGFLQALAALSEFGGGCALIVGLLTPLAMFGVACTMAVAMLKVHFPHHDPFVNATGGRSYESAAHYFIVALGLLLTGPGVLSVDAYLFNRPVATPYTP